MPDSTITSTALRALAGLLLIAAALVLGMLVLVAGGGPQRSTAVIALGVFTLGFVAVRWTSAPARRPWTAVRVALGLAAAIDLFLLAALPWPPGPAERTAWATLAAMVLATLATAVVAGRAPRLTVVLAAALAVYAVQAMVRFLALNVWGVRSWASHGEAYSLALFLVVLAAQIASFVLCWPALVAWLRSARRSREGHAGA